MDKRKERLLERISDDKLLSIERDIRPLTNFDSAKLWLAGIGASQDPEKIAYVVETSIRNHSIMIEEVELRRLQPLKCKE